MRPAPRHLPSSAASFTTSIEARRPIVLDLDTATLDDLRRIDRRSLALRVLSFQTPGAFLLLVSHTDMALLVGVILLLGMIGLTAVAGAKPSLLTRMVARAHGCSPRLTTLLGHATDAEINHGFLWKRSAWKDVQFQHILTHREEDGAV